MRSILMIGFALAAAVSSASASDLGCPATIDGDETGGLPESFKFRYVSFFDGDPREMADLAPEEGPNPKVLEQRWQFSRAPGRVVGRSSSASSLGSSPPSTASTSLSPPFGASESPWNSPSSSIAGTRRAASGGGLSTAMGS